MIGLPFRLAPWLAAALLGVADLEETEDFAHYDGRKVNRVQFLGLGRLSARRLRDFLDTRPGRLFDHRVFLEDLRRLRNLELFDIQAIRIVPDDRGIAIQIRIRRKWSLLPYFNYFQGGGSWKIVSGLYDANALGLSFLLDARFLLFDGRPGGILFFKYPRLAGLPLDLDADGGYALAVRTTYQAGGKPWRQYRVEVAWAQLALVWEPAVWTRLGVTYLFRWRRYDFTPVSPSRDFLPETGRTSNLGLLLSLGKLAYRDYFMEGLKLDVSLSMARPWMGSDLSSEQISWDFRAYWLPSRGIGNLALWLRGGYETGPTTVVEEFALGGLLGLRGFRHGQFLGRAYVAGTFEYRSGFVRTGFPIMAGIHRIFRGRCLLFQGALFADLGAVAGSNRQATPDSGRLLASVGAGFRAVFVRFYRAVLRVDLALGFSPYLAYDLVIATQQTF